MKSIHKSQIIIFILGLVFIVSAFAVSFLPNSYENLKINSVETLPQGVHIPININTADKATLCLLDDIGEKTAQSIIDYREENGGFDTKEEIMQVSGIGEKTFGKIRNYIDIK